MSRRRKPGQPHKGWKKAARAARKPRVANHPVKAQARNPSTIHTNPPESGDN